MATIYTGMAVMFGNLADTSNLPIRVQPGHRDTGKSIIGAGAGKRGIGTENEKTCTDNGTVNTIDIRLKPVGSGPVAARQNTRSLIRSAAIVI
jgi:hypothetical protein